MQSAPIAESTRLAATIDRLNEGISQFCKSQAEVSERLIKGQQEITGVLKLLKRNGTKEDAELTNVVSGDFCIYTQRCLVFVVGRNLAGRGKSIGIS